jgi:hypothetical protein
MCGNDWRIGPPSVVIKSIPACIPMMVISSVITVISRVPVIMVTVIIVPEKRSPWMPIGGIVAPVPR